MLAHLENLDLSTLLEDLNLLHVGLLHYLDGRLVSISFVCS